MAEAVTLGAAMRLLNDDDGKLRMNVPNPSDRFRALEAEGEWARLAIPLRHKAAVKTFSGPPEWVQARDDVWRIVQAGGIIGLIGSRGTGKTQLAADVLRRVCEAEYSGCYTKAMEFFLRVQASYRDDAGERQENVMRYHLLPFLLVLDNADRRGNTEWEDRMLTHLLDKRYDMMRPTILIANLSEAKFIERLGPDIVDRIRDGGGLIEATWGGFRGAQED